MCRCAACPRPSSFLRRSNIHIRTPWKSNNTYRGRQVRVKVPTTHTWTKRRQWNSHCRKTTYIRDRTGQWTVCHDMPCLPEWQTLDPSMVHKAVTVIFISEWYVKGDEYFAVTAFASGRPLKPFRHDAERTQTGRKAGWNSLSGMTSSCGRASEYNVHCQWDAVPSSWSFGRTPHITWEPQ